MKNKEINKSPLDELKTRSAVEIFIYSMSVHDVCLHMCIYIMFVQFEQTSYDRKLIIGDSFCYLLEVVVLKAFLFIDEWSFYLQESV